MERVNIDIKQAPRIFGSGEPGRNGCMIRDIDKNFLYIFKKDGVYKYFIPDDLVYTQIIDEPKWEFLNIYNKPTPEIEEPKDIRETFTKYDYAFEAMIYILTTATFYKGASMLSGFLKSFRPEAKEVLKNLFASNQLAEYSKEMKADISEIISDFMISPGDFDMNQDNLTNEEVINSGLTKPSNVNQFLNNPGIESLGKMFNKSDDQMIEILNIKENEGNRGNSFFAKVSKNVRQDLGVSILESIGSGDMIYSVDEVSMMDVEKSKNTAAAIYKAAENITSGYKTTEWTPVREWTPRGYIGGSDVEPTNLPPGAISSSVNPLGNYNPRYGRLLSQ